MKEKNHYYNPLINEVLKDKEKIEKGSRIIEKKPRKICTGLPRNQHSVEPYAYLLNVIALLTPAVMYHLML